MFFFPGLGSLEGQTLEESCQELRAKFWDFYKVGVTRLAF